MRRLLPALLFTGFVLIPSAKADLFIYDLQATGPGQSVHVRFELPTFEQTVLDQTTFDIATWTFSGSPTNFSISGGSAGCDDGIGGIVSDGPCWIAANSSTSLQATLAAPAFSAPGTFTQTGGFITTMLTITDVPSTVPEPSALVLLASALLAVCLVACKRRRALTNAPSFASAQGRALP